jgi:hypothetical protein
MGRPRANLAVYSPFGAIPMPPPAPPDPAWLAVVPAAGVQTWSDLAVYAMGLPTVQPMVSLFTNWYQPTSESTLASFTPPMAAGLAAQALGAPIRGLVNPFGRAVWSWPTALFTAVGAGLPVLVWGYYVYCTDPWTGQPGLLWAQRLVTGFGFTTAGQTLPIPLATSFAQC